MYGTKKKIVQILTPLFNHQQSVSN